MIITCHHPASSYGIPVILDDDGDVLDYPEGLTKTLAKVGWTREELAKRSGYKSARSIEKFWQGVPPSAQLLNVLGVELEAPITNHENNTIKSARQYRGFERRGKGGLWGYRPTSTPSAAPTMLDRP